MKTKSKKELLKIIFLGLAVLDVFTVSILLYFLLTILIICIVLGTIMYIGKLIIIIYQVILSLSQLEIFLGLGYLSVAIIYLLIIIFLIYLTYKLLNSIKNINTKTKRFLYLNEIIKEPKIKKAKKEKKYKKILIMLSVIALISFFISVFTGEFAIIKQFIIDNFEFGKIYKYIEGWVK
ncbi:MAG: hypothetical protein ACK5HP_00040 [Bacilli bacterium]